MRNSDPDATVYWLARMVESRRGSALHRPAARAIRVGGHRQRRSAGADRGGRREGRRPLHRDAEGNTALAQAAIYLATAPKSNAVYEAYSRAAADAHHDVAEPVPLHLRNAPTKLMKDLEYGKGYQYAHDDADAVADMSCLPPSLEGRKYYEPTRARLREGDQAAARRLGGDQEEAGPKTSE